MKKYTAPQISVCRFDAEDIITDSGVTTAVDMVTAQLGSTNSTVNADWDNMSIMD